MRSQLRYQLEAAALSMDALDFAPTNTTTVTRHTIPPTPMTRPSLKAPSMGVDDLIKELELALSTKRQIKTNYSKLLKRKYEERRSLSITDSMRALLYSLDAA